VRDKPVPIKIDTAGIIGVELTHRASLHDTGLALVVEYAPVVVALDYQFLIVPQEI
jgi:hypothetical protein